MIRQQWDIDIVGVLPTGEYMMSRFDLQPAFINSQNACQYTVRPISETPANFPNVSIYTGYPNEIEPYGFEDLPDEQNYNRLNNLKDFLQDYLFIFKPLQKGDHYCASNVRLVAKPLAYTDSSTFVPVPVFNEQAHKMNFDEFIERLKHNKFVGKIQGISNETSDTPSLVLWKENDETLKVVGEFEKHRYAYGGFLFTYKTLKVVDFKESWFGDIIPLDDNKTLIFIGNNTYQQMLQAIEEAEGFELPEPDPVAVPITETEVVNEQSESYFIDSFIQLTREAGFNYDLKDLINFHTAMKTSNLVILSGISGVGKSQLVQLYGKALGMDDQQLTIIPVRPSWTDDADLIGHVDSIHMVYRPGDSGLINTLNKASQEKERLFIICFDEMNLARVEHYFSQFLSVLEMEPQRRKLKLYNDEIQQRLYNGSEFPSVIPIGDNVIFTGTVNVDESTYHFSDKVLDRSNVITLNVLDFNELKNLTPKRNPKRLEVSFGQYLSYKQEELAYDLTDREYEFLNELNQCFQRANKKLGFGPRVVRQIARYLAFLPNTEHLTREQAFDLQIVQRILTKLRGPEEQLKVLLGSLNSRTGQVEGGLIDDVLENFSDISSFEQTGEVLINKARELKLYGYSI
jgi:hypothetical protein